MDCQDKACIHALSRQSMDCLLNPKIEEKARARARANNLC